MATTHQLQRGDGIKIPTRLLPITLEIEITDPPCPQEAICINIPDIGVIILITVRIIGIPLLKLCLS